MGGAAALSLLLLGACLDEGPLEPGSSAAAPRRLHAEASLAHQEEPSLAVLPDGRIVAAWKEMASPASTGSLGVGWSDDGGTSWTTTVLAPEDSVASLSDPWLAADGAGRLHLARFERLLDGSCRVAAGSSVDGGASWGEFQGVHEGGGCPDKPALTGTAGRLTAVYQLIEDTRVSIRVVQSTDGGETWTSPMEVAPTTSGSRLAPTVSVLGAQEMVVAWWEADDGNVEVSRTVDAGSTWSEPVRANAAAGSVPRESGTTHPLRPPFPSLADAGEAVVLAWPTRPGDDWDVMVARSADRGATWSPEAVMAGAIREDQWMVGLAADAAGNVHAALYDNAAGPTALRLVRSSDGGRSWTQTGLQPDVVPSGERARLGDYLGLVSWASGVFVAWTAVSGSELQVWTAPSGWLERGGS